MYTNRVTSGTMPPVSASAGQGTAAHQHRRERHPVRTVPDATPQVPAPVAARTDRDEQALAQLHAALRGEASDLPISALSDHGPLDPARVRFVAVRTGDAVTSRFSSGYARFVVNLDDITTTYFAHGEQPHCVKGAIVEADATCPADTLTTRIAEASAWLDQHAYDRRRGSGWDKPLFDVRA